MKKARLIAFYLPQYHPVPENDIWWGKGFTEWTNVAKAKPLFRGHYQPHIPSDLGYYDLRVPESRNAQAELAKAHGIEAFCYYHYWFAGKRILERPFNEVLASGEPDFPFCLCWANETWTGIWHGASNRILIEQTYPAQHDHDAHFDLLFQAFIDDRYLKIEGKPLFLIYRPWQIPDLARVLDRWRHEAVRRGLPGLYLVSAQQPLTDEQHTAGFDAFMVSQMPKVRAEIWVSRRKPLKWLRRKVTRCLGLPAIYSYERIMYDLLGQPLDGLTTFPCLIPNWDNTPRSGVNGLVLHGSTPELFRKQVRRALEMTGTIPADENFMFVKAWNEWAEGNHLEPDMKFGSDYLAVLKDEIVSG